MRSGTDLVTAYGGRVEALAVRTARRCGFAVPVDDLYQEGVVALLQVAERYDPERQRELWAFAQFRVRGAMRDVARRNGQRNATEIPDYDAVTSTPFAPVAGGAFPDIVAAIAALPSLDATVTALYYFADLEHKEVGALLGFTAPRSWQILQRAHRRLVEALGDWRHDLRRVAAAPAPALDPWVAERSRPDCARYCRLAPDAAEAIARVPTPLQAPIAKIVLKRGWRIHRVDDWRGGHEHV